MKKSFAMAALSCLTPIALFGCQTATPSAPIYAINYAAGTQQNQVIAAGSSATLSVGVSSNTGGTVSGLVLNATVNNGYCSLPSATVSTDANGNASFGVLAGSGGSLACTVAVTLPSVNASRATLNFTINIRAIQRVLSAPVSSLNIATLPNPTVINLASTTAQMTLTSPNAALGSANDSLNLRISNLPGLPNSLTYVLWATNAADLTTGLDAFRNASNAPLSIGFNATPPVNTGTNSPITPVDNKSNYNRVFVTIESGSVIPATPSTQIALDTNSSLFVQGK